LLERLLNYRVFADAQDRMNLSLRDIEGGLLLVPQFTLVADTSKGNRPGFSKAATPEQAERLFDHLLTSARQTFTNVTAGQFAADMQVSLINDGPVSFWLETKKR
ncbi:MAG: D-tyrosyl-tRNA(Tyr) deacylase, partial [Gammaproteobacteria bacterium]|nr:D-tyrosyl-tRNA(Tyr) deacylase [Gammaproteobacteria bacterium]